MRTFFRWCFRSLLLVVLMGAAYFGFVAWQTRSLTRSLGGMGQAGASPFALPALASALAPALPQDISSIVGSTSSSKGRSQATTYLVVNVGAERSEVVIAGITLGNTPYVGEIDCKPGSKIVVTVLPPVGAPRTFDRVCDRQEIRIVDDPVE